MIHPGDAIEIRKFRRLANCWRWLALHAVLTALVLAAAASPGLPAAFLAPDEPLAPGTRASLRFYVINNSNEVATLSFATSLTGRLVCGSNAIPAVLTLNTNHQPQTVSILPGSLVKTEYQFQLPPDLTGIGTLEVSNYNPVTLVFRPVTATAPPAQTASLATPRSTPVSLPATDAVASSNRPAQMADFVRRHVVSHISYYEPIYFILGNPIAEFQLSLKYQIFNFANVANPWANVADHAFFAYTQTSYWDLLTADPYFYDNSYKPSLFIFYPALLRHPGWQLDLQGGTEHESNGKGGSGERSLYTAYLQPTLSFGLPENLTLSLQPRARFYYWVGDNNPDIANYRGYADLLASLTWQKPGGDERIQFATKFRIGDEGSHPGWLFDLRFNLAGVPLLDSFNPTIQLQYFTGYGQTLIQYDQKSSAFRAGLCLWY